MGRGEVIQSPACSEWLQPKEGLDLDETFSFMDKFDTVRVVIGLIVQNS